MLDLHWCVGFSLVVVSGGASLAAVSGLLVAAACRGAQALGHAGFSSCSTCALEHRLSSLVALLCGMWDLPGPGIEPVSPALMGRVSSSEPLEKPLIWYFYSTKFSGISIFFQLIGLPLLGYGSYPSWSKMTVRVSAITYIFQAAGWNKEEGAKP